jgi:hypothetical protein
LIFMSTATAKLLSEFEAPWDSGPLSDDAAAAAGDALAERFDEEERASLSYTAGTPANTAQVETVSRTIRPTTARYRG